MCSSSDKIYSAPYSLSNKKITYVATSNYFQHNFYINQNHGTFPLTLGKTDVSSRLAYAAQVRIALNDSIHYQYIVFNSF